MNTLLFSGKKEETIGTLDKNGRTHPGMLQLVYFDCPITWACFQSYNLRLVRIQTLFAPQHAEQGARTEGVNPPKPNI
jgi:hypothetical protein